MTQTGLRCQVDIQYGGPEDGNVVLCHSCKRGCHAISCSKMVYRTDVKAKRVQVRTCNDCLEASPELYSDAPPREPISHATKTEVGRIYRNRP